MQPLTKSHLPLIAITMGDPAGVGPEIIAAAWGDSRVQAATRPLVIGDPEIMRRAAKCIGRGLRIREIRRPEDARPGPDVVPCVSCGITAGGVVSGACSAAGGEAAYQCVRAATGLALDRQIDGITTAPLNKEALNAAGHHYPGHTELLAELCGVRDFAMMLHLPPGERARGPIGLNIVHVTLHTALRSALQMLSSAEILAKIRLADAAGRKMRAFVGKSEPPRIAVCAVNPHAGEAGLFGDEENRIIAPAVHQAREQEKIQVEGPFPVDTLMPRAASGEFDMVVAMYHDQGHIAIKLMGMLRAVNITLGLPIVRTSVAHGTAFDVAWKNRVDPGGMISALLTCAQLCGHGDQR